MIAAPFLYKGGNQHPGNLVMDAGILHAGKQQGDVVNSRDTCTDGNAIFELSRFVSFRSFLS